MKRVVTNGIVRWSEKGAESRCFPVPTCWPQAWLHTKTRPIGREQRVNAAKRRFWRTLLWGGAVAGIAAAAWLALARPPAVTASRAVRGPAVEAVYATGAVEPVYWAKVSSTQVGRIAELPVKEGESVKTGTVVVKLDDREAKARLAELEARERF